MMRVEVFNAHRKRRMRSGLVTRYVRRVLRCAGVTKANVSVVFVDSRYCRRMNRLYLKHDFVTDVLSFPLENGRVLEGEIYVNLDRARSQAKEFGVSVANEVARLVIHGTLHLVGYDDAGVGETKLMKTEEERQIRYWFN